MHHHSFWRSELDLPEAHLDSPKVGSRKNVFLREKVIWLDQMRADPELIPLAFLLAEALANLVNEQKGYAWPSIAHLAPGCRVSERRHLLVEIGAGRSAVLYAIKRYPVQPNADRKEAQR